MSATNKWQFYAESTLFQSPHPSKLPIPIFDKDGHFVPGPWPIIDNSLSSQKVQSIDPKQHSPKF